MSEEICIGFLGTAIICLLVGFATLYGGTLEWREKERREARSFAMLWLMAFALAIAAGGALAVFEDDVLIKSGSVHSH